MNGAIVHEWIAESGGSEKVVEAMLEAFPGADLYALWADAPDRVGHGTTIYETWLARSPLRRHKALALPFLPATWQHLKPHDNYDWMLVSSHLFAHHARFDGQLASIPKLVYAHTPARYIWTPDLDARGNSLPAKLASAMLRPLDRKRAQVAKAVAANSAFVRDRIRYAWGRDADVIYPPVDVKRIQSIEDWRDELSASEQSILDSLGEGFVLGASRFVPYKELDKVIRTAEIAGRPAVIAGKGPGESHLRELANSAGVPVHFVRAPSDQLLFALYQRAGVYVFPAVEDFGIMPVEAMAAGCPVVVNAVGGAAESVVDGETGAHVRSFLSSQEVLAAVETSARIDRSQARKRAREFDRSVFVSEIARWVQSTVSA